jgi:hypothetical protein
MYTAQHRSLGLKVKLYEMGGACGRRGGEKKYRVLVRKPEGKRPLGRFKRRGTIIVQ